jgi:hypothetical protein
MDVLLLTWSRTQSTVCLGSAASEFHAMTLGAGEAMGMDHFPQKLGDHVWTASLTDSQAAYQCILKGLGLRWCIYRSGDNFHQLVREKGGSLGET